jgi:hypothetical protein
LVRILYNTSQTLIKHLRRWSKITISTMACSYMTCF